MNTHLKLLVFIISTILLSCKRETKSTITIKGEIENLPDGKMVLLDIRNNRRVIDSVQTSNGKFNFELNNKDYPEPLLVELNHIDSLNIRRFLSYKSNIDKLHMSSFYLEDGIEIFGKLIEGVSYSPTIKLMSLDRKIKVGRQTEALFSIDQRYKFTYTKLKKEINNFPDSYLLLSELNYNRHNFTKNQIEHLLSLFDEEVLNSKQVTEIKEYLQKRNNYSFLNTKFMSVDNEQILLLDKNAKINMVILWASWCGPCRQEIPFLKEFYKKTANKPTFHMVSVSLDSEKENWIKALNFFKMDWQQLIINPDLVPFQKDIFKFDGSIPTILFIDSNGKIIDSIRGYDKSNEKKIEEIVNKYI